MKRYTVAYRMFGASEQRTVTVEARNRFDAYALATYEVIPELEGASPFSTWVEKVTFRNGEEKTFGTHEGCAY